MTTEFRKTKNLISHNCKAKYLPNGKTLLTIFNKDIFIDDGWECARPPRGENERTYVLDNPRSDNVRRAKNSVFEIAAANEWEYMVTLTLDGSKIDRYDRKEIIRPFTKWLQNSTARKGLMYVIVPELHEDGAVHFHGLTNGGLDLADSGTVKAKGKKKPIKRETARRYGLDPAELITVYNVDNFPLGYSTAIPLDGNREAVARYMTKYITKDFSKIFGKSYFAGGKELKRKLPFSLHDVKYADWGGREYEVPEVGKVKYIQIDTEEFNKYLGAAI